MRRILSSIRDRLHNPQGSPGPGSPTRPLSPQLSGGGYDGRPSPESSMLAVGGGGGADVWLAGGGGGGGSSLQGTARATVSASPSGTQTLVFHQGYP